MQDAWSKPQLDSLATSDSDILLRERDHQLALWTAGDVLANAGLPDWQAPPAAWQHGPYLERMVWLVTKAKRERIYRDATKALHQRLKQNGQTLRDLDETDEIDLQGSHFLRERLLSFPSMPQVHLTRAAFKVAQLLTR